ncbi:MAG: hypothetical protein KDD82_00815 [Planctomycetes bacterium]|nr:hypothetical protein [Planctomycetota bacterium]
MTPADLRALPPRELRALLAAGEPIDPRTLEDRVFHGTSLGLPRLLERLTWTTFVKAFHRDPASGALRGWNVRTEPGTWTPQLRRGRPRAFGHFLVTSPGACPSGAAAPRGLLLDYGALNPAWHPLARLRDPLVTLPDSGGLLLGSTILALGARLATPSYFCLQAGPALEAPEAPPRALPAHALSV